jgi:hypothetical protein
MAWTGTGGQGESVAAGVYFVTLRAGRQHMSKKIVVLE